MIAEIQNSVLENAARRNDEVLRAVLSYVPPKWKPHVLNSVEVIIPYNTLPKSILIKSGSVCSYHGAKERYEAARNAYRASHSSFVKGHFLWDDEARQELFRASKKLSYKIPCKRCSKCIAAKIT